MSLLSALGLALATPCCLVVDLVGDVTLGHRRTLADILAEGPRLDELSPGRSGVAVLASGPIDAGDAAMAITQLSERWPAVVARLSAGMWDGAVVPVRPIYTGLLAPVDSAPCVWQPVGMSPVASPPGPGPILPRLPGRVAGHLLSGRVPGRSRWLRAWEAVWEMPWA